MTPREVSGRPASAPSFGNQWTARHTIGRGAHHPHHTPTHAYSCLAPAAAPRLRPCHLSGDPARDDIMFRRLPRAGHKHHRSRERARRPRRPARRRIAFRLMAMAGGGGGHNMPSGEDTSCPPPKRLPATDGRGAPPLTSSQSCSGTVFAF